MVPWIGELAQDLNELSPTALISWVLTIIGAVVAFVFWLGRTLRSREEERQQLAGEATTATLIKLIYDGKATVPEVVELARQLLPQAPDMGSAGGGLSSTATSTNSLETTGASSGAIEDRRQFVAVVQSLATSPVVSDREIVLKYAKGDAAAAAASLEKRAREAGAAGASLWRDAAALIKPRDPARAIAALTQAVNLDAHDVDSRIRLSRAFRERDEPKQAERLAEQALSLANSPVDRARALNALSAALAARGDTSEGKRRAQEAIVAARDASTRTPGDARTARALAEAYATLAARHVDQGDVIAAGEAADHALNIYRALHNEKPDDRDSVEDVVFALGYLAYYQRSTGDYTACIKLHEEALALTGACVESDKADLAMATIQASVACRLAYTLDDVDDRENASSQAMHAIALTQSIMTSAPGATDAFRTWNWAHILLARVKVAQDDVLGAVQHIEAATTEARKRVASTNTLIAKDMLCVALSEAAKVLSLIGEYERSHELRQEAFKLADETMSRDPTNAQRRRGRRYALAALAKSSDERSDYFESARINEELLSDIRSAVAAAPTWNVREELHSYLREYAGSLQSIGELSKGLALANEALELIVALHAQNPTSAYTRYHYVISLKEVSSAHLALGHVAEARAYSDRALKLGIEFAGNSPLGSFFQNSLIVAQENDAKVAAAEGNLERGLDLTRTIHEYAKARHDADPNNRVRLGALFGSEISLGDAFGALGDTDSALSCFERALDCARQMKPQSAPTSQSALIVSLARVRSVLEQHGELAKAQLYADEGKTLAHAAAQNKQNLVAQRNWFLDIYLRFADAVTERRLDKASPLLEEARPVAEAFIEASPGAFQSDEVRALLLEMEIHHAGLTVDLDAILAKRQEQVGVRRDSLRRFPQLRAAKTALASSLTNLAHSMSNRDSKAAREFLHEGVDLTLSDLAAFPLDVDANRNAATASVALSRTLMKEGQLKEALTYAQKALAICEDLMQRFPKQRLFLTYAESCASLAATICTISLEHDLGLEYYTQAHALALQFASTEENTIAASSAEARAVRNLAHGLRQVGRLKEAGPLGERLLAISREWFANHPELKKHATIVDGLRSVAEQLDAEGRCGEGASLLLEVVAFEDDPIFEITDKDINRAYRSLSSFCLVDALLDAKRPQEAEPFAHAALADAVHLNGQNPNLENSEREIINRIRVAETMSALGRKSEALVEFDKCLLKVRGLYKELPDKVGYEWDEVELLYKRARASGDDAEMRAVGPLWRAARQRWPYLPPHTWAQNLQRDIAKYATDSTSETLHSERAKATQLDPAPPK